MPKQMVKPTVKEVSGVDRAANLAEGWLLMKALDPEKGNDMPETDAEAFEKALAELPEPLRKALIEQQAQAAADRAMAKAMFDEREDAKFEAVAKSLSHLPTPDTKDADGESVSFAKALRDVATAAPEAYAVIEKTLTAAEAALSTSEAFTERGDSGANAAGSALGKLEGLAKEAQEKDLSLSPEAAFAKAALDNPDLYTQHLAEV